MICCKRNRMTLCSLVRMSASLLLSFAWPGLCVSGVCAAEPQVAPPLGSERTLVNDRYLTSENRAIFAVLSAGDIENAVHRSRRLHRDVVATFGRDHPDSVFSSVTQEDAEALLLLSSPQRQQFVSAYRKRRLAFTGISKLMNQPMPSEKELVSIYEAALSASHGMQELLAADSAYVFECDSMLGAYI